MSTLKDLGNHRISLVFLGAALAFVALAVIGGIRAYSPVPFWDMWEGYLEFYFRVEAGNWGAWWAQHNEHRPVLARGLFWLDLAWFHGAVWFLIVSQYLLAGCICLLFWRYAQEASAAQWPFFGFFLIAWLFSWAQEENFTWGFQSQFFLAQLLPLAAWYFLFQAAHNRVRSRSYFTGASLLGVLALGSMANGVLVLPLMTLYALLVRLPWRQRVLLGGLSVVLTGVYLYGYQFPGHHGSLAQALWHQPLGLLHYVLLYLGNPFFYFFGKGRAAHHAALLAGFFLAASSVVLAWRAGRTPRQAALPLALLTFLLYIAASAVATGGSRLIFGVEQAFSSRYVTPALMAWAALFILYLPLLQRLPAALQAKLWAPFLVLLLIMLPTQLKAWHAPQTILWERNLAALALVLGIRDQSQISVVWVNPDQARSLANQAAARQLSLHGMPLLQQARDLWGRQTSPAPAAAASCQGRLETVQEVVGDPRYLRVTGWINDPAGQAVPPLLVLVDCQGRVAGVALTGSARPEAAAAGLASTGFKGYLAANQQGQTIRLADPAGSCRLDLAVPNLFYRLSWGRLDKAAVTVSQAQVLPGSHWQGNQQYNPHLGHLMVYRSPIQGDAATGGISLRLRRGDRLLYRSGPLPGRQLIQWTGSPHPPLVLPPVPEWTELVVGGAMLPEEFDLSLSDQGTGRDEWSEIAVLKD